MNSKRIILSLSLIGAALGPAGWALGRPETPAAGPVGMGPIRYIAVTGEGRTSAIPDRALLTLGVETREASAAEAVAANAASMDKLRAALTAAGVEERNLRTSGFSVWEDRPYDPERKGPSEKTSYRAANSLTITVVDVASMGILIDAAARAGANQFQGISFHLEDSSAAEAAARVAAMKDARKKAEALAEAEGLRLGTVISIQEGGAAGPVFETKALRSAAFAGAATQVSPGETEVTASVSVVYVLEG